MRHGGRILVDQLRIQGCDTVFLVPGESYLAALDGLHDTPEIRTVVCRQEGGAAMMAEAHGKMTGRPGICFVTRGPGATSASAGVHVAAQNSTPMILFIGQVARDTIDREGFQEVDYRRMFAPLAKWAAQIDATERIPEYLSRAYHVALSGRPGPVVLALPEDMLSAPCDVPDGKPALPAAAKADDEDMKAVAHLLGQAERPLMLVGGSGWSADCAARVADFCESRQIPVCTAFRCQDYVDNRRGCYVGHAGVGIDAGLARTVCDADVLLVLGARLGEITSSGYTLVDIPNPTQKLIHVHADASEIGRVYRPDLALAASADSLTEKLEALEFAENPSWAAWTHRARADYLETLLPAAAPGDVNLGEILRHLNDTLPEDAIISNGAGNYAAFVHRFFQYKRFRTQMAPTSGSMGYGLPAAIAAKIAAPERQVVCFAGDGCFLMHGQELATACQQDLPLVIIIANNGMYGTIRMYQEKRYPARVVGTTLHNPDFTAYAKSFGAHGERVTKTAQFADAFERAKSAGRPAVIELIIDPEALAPTTTLSEVRAGA
jgi:acetolactate synthase I/II/III large subunit